MSMNVRLSAVAAVMSLCAGAQVKPALSVAVSKETVPAGGIAQVKVSITEPKPILRATMSSGLDEVFFPEILGIAAGAGMTGAARRDGGVLRVSLTTATAADSLRDYPILTVAVRTAATLPAGSNMPVAIDLGASFWTNLLGQPYDGEVKAGGVTIGGASFIGDVKPGGGLVKAGQTFTVLGGGFAPGMKVKVEQAKLDAVSSNEFRMKATADLKLDGARIRIELPNRESQTYFSYPRATTKTLSADPALAGIVPVFSSEASLEAFTPLSTAAGVVNALGLHNPGDAALEITLDALNLGGVSLLTTTRTLAAGEETLLSAEEFFGAPLPPGAITVRVRPAGPARVSAAQVDKATADIQAVAVITTRTAAY